jgi:hypothetical protein
VLNRMALIALAESLERTYPVLSESLAQFAGSADESELEAFIRAANAPTEASGEAERKRWFEQWWSGAVWARKGGKAETQRAYLKAVKTPAMRDKVFRAAKEQTPEILRRAASTPSNTPIYPATWLNQGRWDDEPAEIPDVAPQRNEPAWLAAMRARAEGR